MNFDLVVIECEAPNCSESYYTDVPMTEPQAGFRALEAAYLAGWGITETPGRFYRYCPNHKADYNGKHPTGRVVDVGGAWAGFIYQ